MTLKTSSADRTHTFTAVFLWQLRRSAPLGLLGAIVFLAFNLWAWLRDYGVIVYRPEYEIIQFEYLFYPILALSLVLPPFLLRHVEDRRQSDLFHALPVSRTCLFLGNAAAGLCWMVLPPLASTAFDLLFSLLSGWQDPLRTRYLLYTMGFAALLGTLTFVFFLLAAACSGTLLEYGVNALLFSGCIPALVFSIQYLCASVIPGSLLPQSFRFKNLITFSTPPFSLGVTLSEGYSLKEPYPAVGPWQILWWALLTLILLGAGILASRRWKNESTGGSLGFPRLKLALGSLGGAAAALAAGCFSQLFGWNVWQTLLVIIFVLAAVWLITECCIHKTLRNACRHFGQLLLSLVLCAAILLPISSGLGLDTAIPSPETVSGISVSYNYLLCTATEFEAVPENTPVSEERFDSASDRLVYAAVQSPEGRSTAETLQKKLIEFERAWQYPYLPGRQSTSTWIDTDINLIYHENNGEAVKRYPINSSNVSENAMPLYNECISLAGEIVCSEEFVKGLFPLCAIDAAYQIGKRTDDWEVREYWQLSEAKDEASFRKALEEALLDDFTHGRCLWGDAEDSYEIYYKQGQPFTARGGLYRGEPAQGKKLVIPSDANVAPYDSFTVYSSMTSTVALLDQFFPSNQP